MKDQVRKWKNAHLNFVPRSVIRRVALKRMAERDFSTPGIRYKIASSQDELKRAFALFERSYVERGIASSGQVRMKIRNILPTTTTFIVLRDDTVVGTVMKDLPAGSAVGLFDGKVAIVAEWGLALAQV